MTEEKYKVLLEALELIGSHKYCNCGCPTAKSARIAGPPAVVWSIANRALKNIGHEVKVYNENMRNRQTA